MKKLLDSTFCLYVCSWDFILASIMTGGYIYLLSNRYGGLTTNIMKDIFVNFGIYIPVLSIIVTIFVLSLTVLITTLSEDFLLYLEEHNHVSTKLKNYHITGFRIYFMALLGNIGLQVYIHQILPSDYGYSFFWYKFPFIEEVIVKVIYCITVFLTLYSLFYALSLISHLCKLLDFRMKYIKKYRNSDRR